MKAINGMDVTGIDGAAMVFWQRKPPEAPQVRFAPSPRQSRPYAKLMPQNEVLDTRQVSAMVGLCERTIENFAISGREGFPKGFKVGRSKRYRRSDIEKWIQSRRA